MVLPEHKFAHHASDTALLPFQDVRVPAAVLGEVGPAFRQIMWTLQGWRDVRPTRLGVGTDEFMRDGIGKAMDL
jgi:hypothetical protein